MKQLILIFCIMGLGFVSSGQRAYLPANMRNISVKQAMHVDHSLNISGMQQPYLKSVTIFDEYQFNTTRFDDQSNASIQNRLYYFEDGAFGAIWTTGQQDAAFPDRGTGYVYYDGSSWGPNPTERIEDERCGWPSYAPWGPNGEIVASHNNATGVKICTRTVKGTGTWSQTVFSGPPDHERLIWPRLFSSGTDHNNLFMLAVTASTDYSGTPYEGLNGALLYSKSSDGGNTWDMTNEILPGMGADYYYGYTGDTYTFAEPRGNTVAFVAGESWYDMFLMKSTDGGETFTKTLIWEHPYPFWSLGTPTDTFYCADGAHSLVIDNSDMVHLVFGINRSIADASSASWFPFVDGIGYWNETMPTFSNNHHALDPYGHPESELVEDYNLIGWTQDVDGDGQITYIGNTVAAIGNYYLGLSSMPQLVLGSQNQLYMIFASVTETYHNTIQNYRHLWARTSPDGGVTWGHFTDLNADLVHIFDECVYPSCAARSDAENIYLIYQYDGEPGGSIWGDMDPYGDNTISFMSVPKEIITSAIENKSNDLVNGLGQNYPNPFSESSTVELNLKQSCNLTLKVSDLAGRVIYNSSYQGKPGLNRLEIDGSKLNTGVYLYTVSDGVLSATKTMTVRK